MTMNYPSMFYSRGMYELAFGIWNQVKKTREGGGLTDVGA